MSFLQVTIPDQPTTFGALEATVMIRDQTGSSPTWSAGNQASLAGEIQTEYVDGSSIQFLAGESDLSGVTSGNYRPNPASYTGGTVNPDGTASGGNFSGNATSPGVFGARVRALVFDVLTVDVAYVSFYNTDFELASGALPIFDGGFFTDTLNFGISSSLIAIDGLPTIAGQVVPDEINLITDAVGLNLAIPAQIATTGPLTRRLFMPISFELTLPVDDDPAHDLSATVFGAIVADATLPEPASVAGRHLFYNQSGTSTRYDGNNLAINASDDNAIATDKTAYHWEDSGAATFANVSSYTKGINGIMVDISGSHPSITADDFIFRVGNNNSPGDWATANAPTSISVRAGAGVSGSDRVTIIWDSGAPIKQWLNVIVLANADTGLAQKPGYPVGHADQFFFGNAVGNTGVGDTGANSLVSALDESAIRANNAGLTPNIPITNIYDVNRSANVTAVDESAARLNNTNPTTTLKYLNLTSAPAAPEADGIVSGDEDIAFASDGDIAFADDSGVASALTAPASSSLTDGVPKWLANRIDSIDLNSGAPARLFEYLHDANTPRSRALLQKFNDATDALGLDDELLESLIDDLEL